jgi:hypothetical protein
MRVMKALLPEPLSHPREKEQGMRVMKALLPEPLSHPRERGQGVRAFGRTPLGAYTDPDGRKQFTFVPTMPSGPSPSG